MGIQELLSQNLRHYREAAGLSQEALADRASLHRTYIGSIEQTRGNPTILNVEKIARALDIDPALLLMEPPASSHPGSRVTGTDANSGNSYALIQWTEGGIRVQPLDVRYSDLTIQVLLDLVERGYTGDALAGEYERVHEEITRFLNGALPEA